MRRRTVEVLRVVPARRGARDREGFAADVVVDVNARRVVKDRYGTAPRDATDEEIHAARQWRPLKGKVSK